MLRLIGPDPNYTWIISAKTIGTGISALIIGTTTEYGLDTRVDAEMSTNFLSLLGRRWVTIGGSILGVIGCILGATAQSVPQGMYHREIMSTE